MHAFIQQIFGSGWEWFYRDTIVWDIFGYCGNALFTSRFIVQWFCSERIKRVVVPPIFWHLSFWGSIVGLIYAFHLDKGPMILSFHFFRVVFVNLTAPLILKYLSS